MRIIRQLDATSAGVVAGRHALWFPELEIKVPFQFGGRITKYQHEEGGSAPAETVPEEISILRALAAERMAPPIGDLVHVETLISEHPGAWHADPCGAWGYEMGDARTLPPGRFSLAGMQSLSISGSLGAWGDIVKPGNVVNGYLVDVRRSAWDMLRWVGDAPAPLPIVRQDLVGLRDRVHRDCQFPPGERAEAYQDFWIAWQLCRGQRRVYERALQLGFNPRPGEAILDIGCQAGGFLQYAHASGARAAGVEIEGRYIECGRALARSCAQNICIRQMDVVREREAFLDWVRSYFPKGIDHLLLLSMEKHLGEEFLFGLVDAMGARRTYIETNAVAADNGRGDVPSAPMKLEREVAARGGKHVGDSRDRNLRRLYQIGDH